MAVEVTFSELLRQPNEVIDRLESGDVLITRRGGDTLRLSKADTAAREIDTLQALAMLIAASLDEEGAARLAGRLEEPFPWIALLPEEHQRSFVGEFLRIARACAEVGRFERLTIVLNAWRATAEAYADPLCSPDTAILDVLDAPEFVEDPRSA